MVDGRGWIVLFQRTTMDCTVPPSRFHTSSVTSTCPLRQSRLQVNMSSPAINVKTPSSIPNIKF